MSHVRVPLGGSHAAEIVVKGEFGTGAPTGDRGVGYGFDENLGMRADACIPPPFLCDLEGANRLEIRVCVNHARVGSGLASKTRRPPLSGRPAKNFPHHRFCQP